MKSISLILLLAGLLTAPGYYFYCTMFSGSEIDEITVFSQDVSSISAGGFTFRQSGNSQWNSPISLELSPEMNPIAVNAKARYLKPTSGITKRTRFMAEVFQGSEKIWEDAFSVSSKKDDKKKSGVTLSEAQLPRTTIHLGAFTIPDAGTYTLDVHQNGEKEIAVASLVLELRRNVTMPNMKVVLGGGIAIVLAIGGLIISSKRK